MTKKSRKLKLDAGFWRKFSKLNWEKKPAVFKNVESPILSINAEQIFTILVQFCERCRKTGSTDGLKFYVNGQPQYFDQILESLPVQTDRSLAGYHRRMSQQYADYCLVCDHLLKVSSEQWDLLGSFMQGLFDQVGLPNRFAEIGLYLGNYRKTPFGVHVDGCGVLSLPVVGRKKFRLWDAKYVAKNPDLKESHRYSAFKAGSSLLQAGPGDMTYWPSSYWHIAESTGEFSATWSIGVWVDQDYSEILTEILRPLLSQKLAGDAKAKAIRYRKKQDAFGRVTELPDVLNRSIALLMNLRREPEKIADEFLRYWLMRLSRQGFKEAPSRRPLPPLLAKDVVARKNQSLIRWAPLANGQLCLALNGRLFEIKDTLKSRQFMQKLNRGESCALDHYFKGAARDHKTLQGIYYEQGFMRVT